MMDRNRFEPRAHPAGFTLVELLFSLVILAVVLGGALTFVQSQIKAFTFGNDRMARLQSYRFAAGVLEKDIRIAGVGVPGNQPILVYAGGDVVAFNANYLSNVQDDPSAVYYDGDATADESLALRVANAFTIPGSSFIYPAVDYVEGGIGSPAETIIFYFDPEPDEAEGDERYTLYRQVNAGAPEIVARNLYRHEDRPFFSYLRPRGGDSAGLEEIESLPLLHDIAIHGSNADTARTGQPHMDQVRGIRINYQASAPGAAAEGRTVISRLIHLPDLGTVAARTCGASPLMDGLPDVDSSPVVDADGEIVGYEVIVSWIPSVDEEGGEKDVNRYVVWRRMSGTSDWNEPIESVRANGDPGYYIVDAKVTPGESYQYGVAAQDCTPNLSPIAISATITIPAIP